MIRRSFLLQNFLLFLVLTLTAVFATTLLGFNRYYRFSYRQSSQRLLATARALGNLMPTPEDSLTDGSSEGKGRTDSREAYHTFCRQSARGTGLRITIIDTEGVVLGDSAEDPASMDNHADRPEIIQAARGGAGTSLRHSATVRKPLLYAAAAFNREGSPDLYLRTALPYETLQQTLQEFYVNLAVLTLAILLLSALASFLVARSLSTRIAALKGITQRFAQGEFQPVITNTQTDEFREIHQALNAMGAQLKERLETVEKQKNELRAVLNGMEEPVIVLAPDLTIKSLNPAAERFFQIDMEETRGSDLLKIIRSSPLHRFASHTLKTGRSLVETLVIDQMGPKHMQIHSSILKNIHGGTRGVLLVLNDVTQLKQLEQVQKDFVSNVSHELRTPITSIKGYVETLLDNPDQSAEQLSRFLPIIDRHTERLNSIIDDLLTLSRIEQNQQNSLEREVLPLADLMSSALTACRPRAQRKGITLRNTYQGDEVITVHPLLAEQALINLIDNAVKYSPENTEITLSAEPMVNPAGAAVSVEDQGPGIPLADQERIFERFYRVDKARSRAAGGTGLGLSIVKHIAESHGGWVKLKSTPGRGSCFTLFFVNI